MKNDFNLFSYLSRELSKDAFLMWLFNVIDQDEELLSAKDGFFEAMVLRAEDRGKTVTDIQSRRKEIKWERQSDIVLDFKLDGIPKTTLFETKISSLTTLRGYRNIFPELYSYVYLEIGVMKPQERLLAEKHGYLIRQTENFLEALRPLATHNSIIRHYCQHLEFIQLGSSRRKSRENVENDNLFKLRSKYRRFT